MTQGHHILTVDSLPLEILYDVFEYIPFYDLKTRIPLVCKKFRYIQQRKDKSACGPIDKILFRDKPLPKKYTAHRKQEDYKLHPAFAILDYMYAKSELMTIRNSWHGFQGDIKDLAVGQENAVSPAVSELYFHPFIRVDDPVHVKGTADNGAVTVMDVMNAVRHIVKYGKASESYHGYWWTGVEKLEIHDDGLVHIWDDYHSCTSDTCHHALNNDPHPNRLTEELHYEPDRDILANSFMDQDILELEICDLLRGTFLHDEDW